jgi:transcriptional regulator with XRE-family HTH domain
VPETTVDVAALYAALDQQRRAAGLSWRELAARLGLSASTFTRMAQGHRPDVDAFATLLRWLGMPAESFMRPATAAPGRPEPEPLAMISSYLRSARALRPEDAEALEDIIQAAYRRLVRQPPPDDPPPGR